MKISKERALELGIASTKEKCKECVCYREELGKAYCELDDQYLDENIVECPDVQVSGLFDKMTAEEYFSWRHNMLEW